MKKLILIISLLFLNTIIFGQKRLPVPGSEDWKKLKRNDRVAACQIDIAELDIISNEDLFNKCLSNFKRIPH